MFEQLVSDKEKLSDGEESVDDVFESTFDERNVDEDCICLRNCETK